MGRDRQGELTTWSLTESAWGAQTRKRQSPVLSGVAPRMSRILSSITYIVPILFLAETFASFHQVIPVPDDRAIRDLCAGVL